MAVIDLVMTLVMKRRRLNILCALLVTSTITSASRVAVRITRPLAVPAASAKAAFLDFTWSRGGGIPGLVTSDGDRRTLWPIALQEALLPAVSGDDSMVRYTVTDSGPVLSVDVLPSGKKRRSQRM